MITSKISSDPVQEYFRIWASEKKRAYKTQEYGEYKWFLQETKKTLGKVYASLTHEELISVMDDIFKLIACELKELSIKSKEKNMLNAKLKKTIKEMDDTELKKAYEAGCEWVLDHEKGEGDKNMVGEVWNEEQWDRALKRLEHIERELQDRQIPY